MARLIAVTVSKIPNDPRKEKRVCNCKALNVGGKETGTPTLIACTMSGKWQGRGQGD